MTVAERIYAEEELSRKLSPYVGRWVAVIDDVVVRDAATWDELLGQLDEQQRETAELLPGTWPRSSPSTGRDCDAAHVETEQTKTYPYKALAGRELVPALPIRLKSIGGDLLPSLLAVLDSGADGSTFPVELAAGLGIELEDSCEKSYAETADGTVTCWIYRPGIKAVIDGNEHHLKASFCEGLAVPLLGRTDFFEVFTVTFDQRAKSFTLEPLQHIRFASTTVIHDDLDWFIGNSPSERASDNAQEWLDALPDEPA